MDDTTLPEPSGDYYDWALTAKPERPYHQSIGMDSMSPFEVASGSDVVAIGREYPDLIMRGGIDKRILAKSQKDIDTMVESVLPIMRKRGGYIPCVDHGTPEETPFENYLHFRKRCLELGG